MVELAEQWSETNRPVETVSDDGLGVWERCKLLWQTLADLTRQCTPSDGVGECSGPRAGSLFRRGRIFEDCCDGLRPGHSGVTLRQHLGQPFVTTKSGGSGLGLYNATNLCVALGGRLEVGDSPDGVRL